MVTTLTEERSAAGQAHVAAELQFKVQAAELAKLTAGRQELEDKAAQRIQEVKGGHAEAEAKIKVSGDHKPD